MQKILQNVQQTVKQKFVFNTCNNIFVLVFINAMGFFAGQINMILAVALIVIILSSAIRDMLGTPVKHFFLQLGAMLLMVVAATLVATLPKPLALFINFAAVFLLVYLFTYETSTHMYFPYILGYLFLLYIAPVGFDRLAPRLLCCLVSAILLLGYQFVVAHKRVRQVHQGCLLALVGQVRTTIGYLLSGQGEAPDPQNIHSAVLSLSKEIYDRRRSADTITRAQCATLDAGRALEHLALTLIRLPIPLSPAQRSSMLQLDSQMTLCAQFLEGTRDNLIPPSPSGFFSDTPTPAEAELLHSITYIMEKFLCMTDPALRHHCTPSTLNTQQRLLAILAPSPVRLIYALRVAILTTLFAIPVMLIPLKYGKWLMFTLSSICLPYADDSPLKAKKRMLATLIGGAVAVLVFSVVHSPLGRTLAMILVGYLSSYFVDYTGTYACATFGALGGAVFMSAFTIQDVGAMYLLRICYIAVGILIALLATKLIFPYRRIHATAHLRKRYEVLATQIARCCAAGDTASQRYYFAVLHSHLVEDKLRQNYAAAQEDGLDHFLTHHRTNIRDAHVELFGATPLEIFHTAWQL